MRIHQTFITLAILVLVLPAQAIADEFNDEEMARWEQQFMDVVKEGRRLWTSPELGTNGVVCAQCHPNGANTHPETYPKFQKQLGKVALLWEMANWCISNTVEGDKMAADDPNMIAIQAYLNYERRGVPMEPGKH